MFQRILLCSDGSERSIQAAAIAADIAQCRSARLSLLHVCELPDVDEPFPGAPSLSKHAVEDFVRTRHLAVIQRTLGPINDAGVTCDILEEVGHPVETISRIAESQDFDLIVLGSRARKTDKAAELGSVSFGVVQRVHCPVLIVK